MLDRQKIVSAMRKIYDLENSDYQKLQEFTRKQFLMLFDEIIHSKLYDYVEEENKS